MTKDEEFLRKQIESAVKSHSARFMRELTEVKIADIVEAGVNRWRQGGMKGIDAVSFAINYARDTYKRTIR